MDTREEYLTLHKMTRQRRRQIASVLAVFSLIVAIVVFWWLKLTGITVTGEAFCNIEEHLHNGGCYEYTLICTDEDETHIHTEECMEEELICEISEHTHTLRCYSNPEADKETASDWEATFEKSELTASAQNNILYIASTQVGYSESTLNYETDENGVQHGYSRYGEWYGNPYGEWSAMFVSFCLNYAKIEEREALHNSGAETMRLQWLGEGLFEEAAFHTAEAGELLFLDKDSDGAADTVGVVKENTDGIVTAIFGDWEESVSEVALTDTSTILGYGLTENLTVIPQDTTEETTAEDSVDTTEETTSEPAEETTENIPEEEITVPQELTDEEIIENYEQTLDEQTRLSLSELSDEDRQLVIETMYMIDSLPSLDEFYAELDRLYEADDTEAEEAYILGVQEEMVTAYAHYQAIEHFSEDITNADKLFELKNFYLNMSAQTYTTGTSSSITFNYVNRGWSAVAPILIYGGSAREIITTGSKPNIYWHGIVVDYNSVDDYYYVSKKYEGGTSSSSSSVLDLEADTEKGFVLFVWMADSEATTEQQNAAAIASAVEVGDRFNISVDPYTLSSGYNSSGYGSFYFTQPPTTVEKPLEEIQNGELSDSQVIKAGGTATSPEGDVEISKTIDGTDIENVFDITLTVRTETNVQTYLEEPDMAVVVVMDISNTMNKKYGTTTRYAAAVEAAENFINQFAKEGKGISQLGFVAFNTSAHEIFDLQPCTTDNADTLIKEMKADTEAIIKATGYSTSRTRFTNVEGGLKRGYDMLKESGNANQYIVFLSDGFPTTYLKKNTTSYEGYEPFSSSGTLGTDGVFKDGVTGYYCSAGTDYSNKGSIRAREMATQIKNDGVNIFSVGIDIGGQTIAGFERTDSLSTIDRTNRTYEIGDASSFESYKTWLKNSIGSGYYYDSTNKTELETAFDNIFAKIKELNTENRYTVWATTDPLPVFDESASVVEFIHFYDKNGKPQPELVGAIGSGEENTATHITEEQAIRWDLKNSGYTTKEEAVGDITTTYYYYTVTYRVRLYNEAEPFKEYTTYETNGNAYLKYRTIVNINGESEISEEKVLNYPRPSVEGYYSELSFQKQSDLGDPLAGAVFTLSHDDEVCSICQGNGTPVTTVSVLTYTSEADGTVAFSKIPSGHIYNLTETVVPEGYVDNGKIYKVIVRMDELSVVMYNTEEDAKNKVNGTAVSTENMVVTNPPFTYILPETGSVGTLPFTICGLCLMALPLLYCIQKRRKERRAKL